MATKTVQSRFLVVSLGNPAPYHNTLHSAGHLALNGLQALLRDVQPSFAPTRFGKQSTLASMGPKYILCQSPTVMNASGRWLVRTWKEILTEQGMSARNIALVLVHDDLEYDLGVVKLRQWERSHRGHNGVKSVNNHLHRAEYRDSKWARISVGIGRPAQRDQHTVSEYVLRPLNAHQSSHINGKAASEVLRCLQELEAKWGGHVSRS